MGSRSTTVKANHRGSELTVHQHETDSPVLPVAQIERLHQIRPDRVDWVFDQTEAESNFRRTETKRINTLVFIQRMASIASGLVIGCVGLGVATYLAINGKEWVGGVIGGTTVVGLVSAFLIGSRKSPAKEED